MTTFCEGNCFDCSCCSEDAKLEVSLSKPAKTDEQIRLDKLESALFTLKAIAKGYGTDPRIYAQNTLNEIGENY